MYAAVAAALLPLAALAQSRWPCELPNTGPYEKAGALCEAGAPGSSHNQCDDYLAELASIEDRSLDEALALAFGRMFATGFEEDINAKQAEAQLTGRDVLRPFVDRAPDNPMVVYAYSYFHLLEEEKLVALLRKVLRLDPTCSVAAHYLSEIAGRNKAYEGNEAYDEDVVEYLTHGYRHSEGTWKLRFAHDKYQWLMSKSRREAEVFRAQVAADMEAQEFPLGPGSRAGSLDVLCSRNALRLRLETACEQAIRELAGRDRMANTPLGDDVLEAVDAFAAIAEEGELGDDGTKYHQMLLELLGAELEGLRTAQFYVVYSRVLRPLTGHDAEADALRRALDLDPRSGKIGLYLSGALRKAGSPRHAIAEVYRHVIANSDERAVDEGLPADYYVEYAVNYLRELEAEENARVESPPSRP